MDKIKNSAKIGTTPIRRHALQIAEAGLAAIDTQHVIHQAVTIKDGVLQIGEQTIRLDDQRKIYLVGVGKCAGEAALALEEILGPRLTAGVILDIVAINGLAKTKSLVGTHPMPSEDNVAAVEEILAFLSKLSPQDLVIVIVSGGGSTLLCSPPGSFSCMDEKVLLEALFRKGATIQEINTVRKHLSKARGGRLAEAAYPAEIVALIFSDVPGNQLEFVASGPTIKDSSSVDDARQVLQRYSLNVDQLLETPKEDKYFERVHNQLVVSNRLALNAMEVEAGRIGYNASIKTEALTGEARVVGRELAQELNSLSADRCLLCGGETTVTVAGNGRGGRNQELVMSAVESLDEEELVLALASDGFDNCDFAGALGDAGTRKRAQEIGLDPETLLKDNNSYAYFSAVGDYISTGRTGSNVSDLTIVLKGDSHG